MKRFLHKVTCCMSPCCLDEDLSDMGDGPRHQVMGTVVEGIIFALVVTEKALDGLPIPAAKGLAGILAEGIKRVQDTNQNRQDFKELADSVDGLKNALLGQVLKDKTQYPEGLSRDIDALFDPLTEYCIELRAQSTHGAIRAYVEANKDKGDLGKLKEKINQAKTDFQVRSSIRIERQQAVIQYRNLVNDLPRATTASWDSGRNTARHQSCLRGTREGVLEIINEWIYNDKPETPKVFWLNGLAGIGKSTIARTIAEMAAEKGNLGGSFFFDRHDEKLRDANLIVPSLVHQLAHHIDYNFMAHIGKALEGNPDLGDKDVSIQFEKLFAEPLKESNRKPTVLLLVLDALDEASPNPIVSQVLRLLLTTDVPLAVRVFLTSRPEKHIRSVFDSDEHHRKIVLHLDIEDHIVQHDIRLFLENRLHSIPAELNVELSNWPSHADMNTLVSMAGNLFIFAATLIRFIANDHACSPERRLKTLLDSQSQSNLTPYAELDKLYMHVLSSAAEGAEGDDLYISDLHSILGAIVSLQNPLPVTALAVLIHQDPKQIVSTLHHVHSIILAPTTIHDIPKTYHLSFADFITDSSRCTDKRFYIDIQSQGSSLFLQCLKIMKPLHYNIGNFDMGPYTVDQLGRPIIKSMSNKDASQDFLISSELEYACQFWCSHLLKIVNPTSEVLEQLKVFSFEYLLFWVEVMSLLRLIESARVAIKDTYQWVSKLGCEDNLIDILYDSYRMIWLHQSQISLYPMCIYSALAFMPQNTLLCKTYKNKYITTSEVVYPKSLTWAPLLSSGTASHKKSLYSVAYISDGQYFATGSEDGNIDLWDPLSGAYIRSFKTYFSKKIYKICFLPEGQFLISMSLYYSEVHLWSVLNGSHVLTFQGHSQWLNDMSVTLEHLATTSTDGTVKIWDIRTAECQSTFQHFAKVNSVWLDLKRDRLLSAIENKVLIWNPISGEQIGEISKPDFKNLIVSPCGKFLAFVFKDTLEIFKNSQELKSCIKHIQSSQPRFAMFSSCGNYIAFPYQNTIVVSRFQTFDKSEIRLQTGMNGVAFSSDSKQLISVFYQTCSLWDIEAVTSQTIDHSISENLARVSCINTSNDQTLVAVGTRSKSITIWNSQTKTIEKTFKTESSDWWISLAFSSDNLLLAAGSDLFRILVLNLQTQKKNTTTQYSEEQVTQMALPIIYKCTALVFSSDNLYLVAGNDNGKVWIFNIKTGDQVSCFNTQNTDQIQRVIFSNKNQALIVANSEKKYQYNIKLISQPILISEEENRDLYSQEWKTQDIFITEQNLVLAKLENNKYSLMFQIIDLIDKYFIRILKVENLIVLSFWNVGYIFEIPRVV